MEVRTALTAVALGAALAGTAGCSFVLVQGPPSGQQKLPSVTCTRGNAVPILDAAVAGVGLYSGMMLGILDERSSGWVVGAKAAGTAMLATGVVFGVSSIVGFTRTSHCRAAQREATQRAR